MDKKAGRNDLCPCGSGKKYKKCCWGREKTNVKKSFKARVLSGNVDLLDRAYKGATSSPKLMTDFIKKQEKEAKPVETHNDEQNES